jgi:hypothetical protein
MAAQITITASDIKGYLGISGTTYDTQIGEVLDLWDLAIEDMIEDEYLASSAYANILKAGKMLVICGHVKGSIPIEATASTASKTTVRMGSYQETTESGASTKASDSVLSADGLITKGMDILKPYLSDAASGSFLQVANSTEDVASEFTLTHKDSDGNIISTGSMEGW